MVLPAPARSWQAVSREQPIDSVKRQVKVNKDQEAGSKHGVMMGNGHHMSSLYFFIFFREWPMFFDSHCDG